MLILRYDMPIVAKKLGFTFSLIFLLTKDEEESIFHSTFNR